MRFPITIATVLGVALCLVPETASAQFPFGNLFQPFQPRPTLNYAAGQPQLQMNCPTGNCANRACPTGVCPTGACRNGVCPTGACPTSSTYGPQLNCRNGVCTTGQPMTPYSPQTQLQVPYQSQVQYRPTTPYNVPLQPTNVNGSSPYYSTQGLNPAYAPQLTTSGNGCVLDAYGRCTNQTHPHYGQPVNSYQAAPVSNVPTNYVSPYRDRSTVPANYYPTSNYPTNNYPINNYPVSSYPAPAQPMNNYYLGQLR